MSTTVVFNVTRMLFNVSTISSTTTTSEATSMLHNGATSKQFPSTVHSVMNFTSATNSTSNYKLPFTFKEAILIGVVLLLLLIAGIALNLITVLVKRSTPKLNNAFMQFIVSLCISDMISAIFSPLFWYRRTLGFDVWGLPDFFCKFYWGVELMTSYVTSLHIVSFAVLRFISIQYPKTYNTISERKANIWIFILWLIGFMCGFIPLAMLFGPENRIRDSDNDDARLPIFKEYQKIAFPIFFYAPIVIVTLMSIFIGFIVNARAGNIPGLSAQSTKKRRRKEHQAFLQLFLIVICFLFGYIPFTAYQFWASEEHPNTRHYLLLDYWFGIAEYLCLRISECLNPIFYNLASSKMRHYTKRYVKEHLPSLMIFYKCRRKTPETPSRSSTSLRHSNSGGKVLDMADLGV